MRHAALYAIAGLVVVGCEALIVSRWHANAVTATTVASVIVEPFFVAIINAFTYADSREDLSLSVTWLRVLERSWAVLLIDLLATLIVIIGLQSLFSTDLFQKLLGSAVIVVAVSLVFADVHAIAVDDAEPWWLLVPRSLGASIATAWQGITFTRALLLFAIGTLFRFVITTIAQGALDAHHVPLSLVWANAIPVMLLLPMVQALTTYVYLDAIGYEPKR
jgi:hypothetical protein